MSKLLNRDHCRSLIAATLLLSSAARAQAPRLPPVHPIGAIERASRTLLGAVSAVRALPGGRVIVNDVSGRKVVMFDSLLASFTVIADTTRATANAYSARAAGIIPFRGDSTLFVDPVALTMLVIDPTGKPGRVMAIPRPTDALRLVGGTTGTPGFDAKGRLVYLAQPGRGPQPSPSRDATAEARTLAAEFPDSAAVIRIDLGTRKVDTAGMIKINKPRMTANANANGVLSIATVTNPMPQVDDWALLSDGSVALLRSQEYRIDWVRPDGSKANSGKVSFQWRHLSDSDKVAFIDSSKVTAERLRAEAQKRSLATGADPNRIAMGPGDGAAMGGALVNFGAAGPPRMGRDAGFTPAGDPAIRPPQIAPLQFVSPSELPDYAPPFFPGAARGDLDGNLWVRTTHTVGNTPVYDVINAKGELVDRIQLPAGRVIAGFGKGGVVYMGVSEGSAGVRLEMARVRLRGAGI